MSDKSELRLATNNPKTSQQKVVFLYTAATLAGTVRLGAAESDEKWLY